MGESNGVCRHPFGGAFWRVLGDNSCTAKFLSLMSELPFFVVKKERRELIALMSIPFKCEPNDCQMEICFANFVSEMTAPTSLRFLSMIRG